MTSVLSAVPYATKAAGLHVKPTYEQVIQYVLKDPDKIQFPDRRATILRNSPYLTQNDGFIELEAQAHEADNRQEQDIMLREFAQHNNLIVAQLQAVVEALNLIIRRGPAPEAPPQQPEGPDEQMPQEEE